MAQMLDDRALGGVFEGGCSLQQTTNAQPLQLERLRLVEPSNAHGRRNAFGRFWRQELVKDESTAILVNDHSHPLEYIERPVVLDAPCTCRGRSPTASR